MRGIAYCGTIQGMDLTRPYLVIPKLIQQPTWGGEYIVNFKRWQENPEVQNVKIGQSYELFDKSNLSYLISSDDVNFEGEVTDAKKVEIPTRPTNTFTLRQLIETDPKKVLGEENAKQYGAWMHLLIKFTQALGNSFQLHIKDGQTHPKWKPKPESWYYFEPGLITLGVKKDTDWNSYQKNVEQLHEDITALGEDVRSSKISFEKAKSLINELLKKYDPWQYVNILETKSGDLVDLSSCGVHHSWEEDSKRAPLGNIVYELQLNVMDDVATIRNFDKGKMQKDGSTRPLQIQEYFQFIDRDPEVNNPQSHMMKSRVISDESKHTHTNLLNSKYYKLDEISFKSQGADFSQKIETFRHLFVKDGKIEVTSGTTTVRVSRGHSLFVPANAQEYIIRNSQSHSTVLISY